MALESSETTPLLSESNGTQTTEFIRPSHLSNIEENDGLPDSNAIWWDKDEDPEHPYHWPRWLSTSNCFLISAMTFLTALASCKIPTFG